jgi:hypothetical protein
VTRAAILLLLAPVAVQGQLQLLLVNGAQQTPITAGATFSLGQIAANASENFVLRALNSGSAPIPIASDTPAISGTGFSITSPATPPPNIAPGAFLDIDIHFAGGPPASYSATFQLNTTSVLLVITSVAAATLSVAPGQSCAGPDSSNTVNFGNIPESQTAPCTLILQNLSSQQLTVSTITVAGTGFLVSQPAITPLNLPPGVSSEFTITFAPSAATSYSGTLAIDTQGLTQTFTLAGTAYNPPLSTPTLQFDTSTAQSGQQVTLTMNLPAPAQIATSGSVNLSFQPDPSVAAFATSDPTIMFVANGARSVPFSIPSGSSQATFGGQAGAVFQTGMTAGKITFTVAVTSGAQLSGDAATSLTLASLPVQVENAAATAIAGALNIQVWGFDNTYSAGAMSFTFQDNLGNPIGSGAVSADFTSQFRTYFTTSADGGGFAMLITFPVTGNAAEVGSVNLAMTNSAGTATISQLTFLNDTGTCVLVGNVLSCPATPTQ